MNHVRRKLMDCGAAWVVLILGFLGGQWTASAFAQTDQELREALETPIDDSLGDPLEGDGDGDTSPDAANPPTSEPETDETEHLPGAIVGLDAGLAQAQIDNKPALVLVTGPACPWCHRLKREMQRSPAREALARWTLIEVDVDTSPDAAKRLGVAALPALRLLRPSGASVAARDGYLSAKALVEWLDEHHRGAAAEADEVLLADNELDAVSVVRLIQHLEDRDALVREAAMRRLAGVPQLAVGPLLEAFSQGSLATRLAALDLLAQWGAPVEEVDPWRPTSISAESLARLAAWSKELQASTEPVSQELSEKQLADAQQQIDRLLTVSVEDGAAIAARLARHADALLPEVYRRLEAAETDDAREKLLALRYRLVASDALVLRLPGGLSRLAARDPQTRRQAAQRLTELATDVDQPLLLELFSDPDPLIREIALRGLQQVGGAAATGALVRLLADPEPNVRAAVLKQLAEQASPALVADVAKYIESEQDADLLVHAIRYLRETPGEPSAKALLPLLSHDAWQVRAESAEALREMLDGELSASNPELTADIYAGLIQRLDDQDAFVVSRAIEALSGQVTAVTIEPLLNTAEKFPQLAPQIIESVASHGSESPAIRRRLEQFAKHELPAIRAAAVVGLHQAAPHALAEWAPAALRDEESSVRVAAAEVIFQGLDRLRSEKQSQFSSDALGESAADFSAAPPSLIEPQLGAIFSGGSDGDGEGEAPSDVEAAPAEDERDPFDDSDVPKNPTLRDELPGDDVEVVEEESADEKPPAEEPAAEDAVAPPADGGAMPDGEAWDRWLADFSAGRGRPKHYDSVVEPLTAMLAADDSHERATAALALVPLGEREAAMPVLLEATTRDALLAGTAAGVLPWLPWEERKHVFTELLTAAKNSEQQMRIAYALVGASDPRATTLLWPMLASEDVDVELASSISSALTSAYFGERYWRDDEVAPAIKARVLADARPHAETGRELEALVALVHMSSVDAEATAALAQTIADDDSRPQQLREDAFQIALVTMPTEQRSEFALAALAGGNPHRQQLALKLLVAADESELSHLRDYEFHVTTDFSTDYSRSTGGPIIPAAPTGVAADDVRPLLTHTDAQTRAYAGYVMALLGEREGLTPLIDFWRNDGKEQPNIDKLVYRAIARQNAGEHLDVLREIYAQLDEYDVREFYWTIRIMSGDDVLRLRKEIRDKHGISNLQ